ncbi:ABC transporter substrate-binding protein [Microbacterium halophytorum]|uniref:ABC transporter substrate-binding protein n=1 Tax=Microbacterium halophytorum TaxID=2067568 RepID=UPI000CFC7E0F|nr:ABC transporter substrate-binding protein [Microbacterium halophytorum]
MPRTPRTRAYLSIAVAASAALALSACAGSDSSEATGKAAAVDLDMAFAVQSPPNSFDPAQLHDGQQRYIWGAIYDTLLRSDTTGEVSPNAAENWEYSDDLKTLTLTLREGMTYSSGDPVTAADVAAVLERTRSTTGPQQNNLAAIESIDAPDDRTLVLNLSHPDANLLVALSYGSGVVADPDAITSEEEALDPIGSGPYAIDEERTAEATSYVLERRDDHWNAEAYPFQTITVRVIQDSTAQFNALMAGEIDAATIQGTLTEQAEGADLELTPVDGVSTGAIILADRHGEVAEPLADVRVRQAINHALDSEGIIDGILAGQGESTSQLFNKTSPAFVEELDDRYDYDPEEARRLLAEAGYEDGFSLTMPENYMVMPMQPSITQALKDVGITVDWEPVPPQQSGQTTNWGMYFNFGGAAAPSRVAALYYSPDGSQNPFKTDDETLAGMLAELQAEADPEAANEIHREMNEYVVEQAWFAPMFQQTVVWATTDKVSYVGDSSSIQDVQEFGAP